MEHSSDWLIAPTTANQIIGIKKPNKHKILIFSPTTSLKRSHGARIDGLADSNEPATTQYASIGIWTGELWIFSPTLYHCATRDVGT